MNLTIEILGTEKSIYVGIDGHYCGTAVYGYEKFNSLEEFTAKYPEAECRLEHYGLDYFLAIKLPGKHMCFTLNGIEYMFGIPCPKAISDVYYDKYQRGLTIEEMIMAHYIWRPLRDLL